ncbi:MAG: class I SAM-dependent methyltransferase [Flavobacteriales bacterium]|nr:class I SAM-dependent methyltransferase [Flavobacteriales bacterium]
MSDFNAKEYWEKRLKNDYSLHGVGYIGLGEEYNKWMYKVRTRIFKRAIKKISLNNSSTNVLDIGSGTGFYIDLWNKQKIKNVEGADITQVAVENLKEKFPENNFYCLDISSSNDVKTLNQGTYDVISIFDVLFHIVDDEKFLNALKNINALLNKNGKLILTDNFIHDKTFRSQHHVSRNIDEFYNALNEAGFKVEYRKPAFVFMNAPVDARGKFLKWIWVTQEKLIYRNKRFSSIVGSFFYPLELLFTKLKTEGPSTEIVICSKK